MQYFDAVESHLGGGGDAGFDVAPRFVAELPEGVRGDADRIRPPRLRLFGGF
jgi:hypothetical protein